MEINDEREGTRKAKVGDYAQDNLGIMYAQGQGVQQDFAQAAKMRREVSSFSDPLCFSNTALSPGSGLNQAYCFRLNSSMLTRSTLLWGSLVIPRIGTLIGFVIVILTTNTVSAQEGLTLTLGRLVYASDPHTIQQNVSVKNDTSNVVPIAQVECGFFKKGELIATNTGHADNIAPNTTAFVTVLASSDISADRAECRIVPGQSSNPPEPVAGAGAEPLCAGKGNVDEVKPIPQSLAAFASKLFGGELDDATSETVYRCVDDQVYICNIGNGFSCDRPSAQRYNPDVVQYCRGNPNSPFVPMSVSGHITMYTWKCVGRRAVIASIEKLDARGFRADMWVAVPGVQ